MFEITHIYSLALSDNLVNCPSSGAAVRDEVRAGLLHGVQERAEAGVHDELPRGVLAKLPGGSRLWVSFEGLQAGPGPVLCEQSGGRALREVRTDSEDRVRERS